MLVAAAQSFALLVETDKYIMELCLLQEWAQFCPSSDVRLQLTILFELMGVLRKIKG